MMAFNETFKPDFLTQEMLDDLLSKAWYRIQQYMITTDLIVNSSHDQLLPVYWIRLNLQKYQRGRTYKKIMAANRRFQVTFKSFQITEETESLFLQYKQCIDFSSTDSVHEYLLGEGESAVFDSQCIEVRDDGKLIAVGYYDNGKKSSAGILNIYHPEYRKYSLGKFLILLKIEEAIRRGQLYYYPGYVCPENERFNYKLFADKNATEVFVRKTKEWLPYNEMIIPGL